MSDISRLWDILVFPGGVHEFRAPKVKRHGTVSGYFDNAADFGKAVNQWNGTANLYIIPNSINPALLARSANRAKE